MSREVVGDGTEHKECVCHHDWFMVFLPVFLLSHSHLAPVTTVNAFHDSAFYLRFSSHMLRLFFQTRHLIPAASIIMTGYCPSVAPLLFT